MNDDESAPGSVLVVEDSALLAALVRDAFFAHGLGDDVRVLKEGHAFLAAYAEALARDRVVRLLVVDIHLPDVNGLFAGREARRLEQEAGRPPAPIVFFSSRAEDDEIRAGVADCFPARFVQKEANQGPATVALVGARMIKGILEGSGR